MGEIEEKVMQLCTLTTSGFQCNVFRYPVIQGLIAFLMHFPWSRSAGFLLLFTVGIEILVSNILKSYILVA